MLPSFQLILCVQLSYADVLGVLRKSQTKRIKKIEKERLRKKKLKTKNIRSHPFSVSLDQSFS